MNKVFKRFLSMMLSITLVMCGLPMSASAENEEVPKAPTAAITENSKDNFTFSVSVDPSTHTSEQYDYYKGWYTDYELTVNKDITFDSNGEDGVLWCSSKFILNQLDVESVPLDNLTLEANKSLKIVDYANKALGGSEHLFTYEDIVNAFGTFGVDVFFTEEFLAANSDLEVKLELKMYNPENLEESYVLASYTYPEKAPVLPTATVKRIYRDDLTFAMNFKADEVSDEQLAYYGDWYADFELKANKDLVLNAAGIDNGTADGYLSGNYADYGWVNVPVSEMKLTKGNAIKIMETAAAAMNQPGLQYTFKEVYDVVKNFDCGVFLTDKFLAANPDFELTLELKLYNPDNLDESYEIGETYEFEAVEASLPTATVTKIYNENLTFAMNFKANEVTEAQLSNYGDWYADFEIKSNKNIKLNAAGIDNGTADGYLSGEYGEYGWVNVPVSEMTLTAGNSIKIMETAAAAMNQPGLKYTYKEVYEVVKDFNCGVFLTDEFLAANPDFELTLELKLYNPENEVEGYAIGEKYAFTAKEADLPTATVTVLEKDDLTFALNFKADEVTDEQLEEYGKWYADFEIKSNKDIKLNAAGIDDGTADGYLSGEYGDYGWINVPTEEIVLKSGEAIKIMETAAKTMNQPGLKYTYEEVYEVVKDFNCGIFLTDEFLAANPDLELTLVLKLYDPSDETESYVIGKTHTFEVPELPTATATRIHNKDLTFAMNFKTEEISDEQLAYYGNWFADFELTVNKDVTLYTGEGADGYLSGQYDAWSENWVNVPFNKAVELKAGETVKVMEFAAELMGEPGLKYKFGEVYTDVQNFDCGMFFTEAFLAANPDLEVKLELRMYNPLDESIGYTVGNTYVFTMDDVMPDLPTATVSEIEKEELTFAMNFKTDEITDEQIAYFENWFADFELTVNKDMTLYTGENSDGYLSGQYDEWSENWVNVPFNKAVELKAGETVKIMEFAAELLGEPGLKYTFKEVYENVKDFDCGVFFEPEFLAANPDIEVTLELKMYNPVDESESYVIGETYVFPEGCKDAVAMNVQTGKFYDVLIDGLSEAKESEKVILLNDVEEAKQVNVEEAITFDLNGYTLKAKYFTCFGDTIDSSESNSGLLKVPANRIMIQENNKQLPIKEGEGYQFFEIISIKGYRVDANNNIDPNGTKYAFQPKIEDKALALLKQGAKASGVTISVRVNWGANNERTQDFVYSDNFVTDFLNSYNSSTGRYGRMFTLTLKNVESLENLNIKAIVGSETGVEKY